MEGRIVVVNEREWLAERFEEKRAHLRAVAHRMLGSASEADDAVQEAWIRLSRSDAGEIENLGGWLTTVVARVCLDQLRTRGSRREEPLDVASEQRPPMDHVIDPEHEAVVGDSIGLALLVVLETLAPEERLAFVLHDLFAVPFDEIAPIVGRSPAAARQLASRARRRVQGADALHGDVARRREIVAAFLAASREGNFEALVSLLDPDAVLRADAAAVAMGADELVRGARSIAETLSGRAKAARLALVDGAPGAVWAAGGRPRVVFEFDIVDGTVMGITLVADPHRLDRIDLAVLED